MALARVKRKHKKRQHREESGSSPSSSSGERKRSHGGGEPQEQGDTSNQAEQQERPQEARRPANQESSSLSFSSDEPQFQRPLNPNNNNMAPPRQPQANHDIRADLNAARPPLPLVSESSNSFSTTSNAGFSSTSNNGASGSGTGSGSNENSGVSNKGSSGSGSNGSSGSGNEGKGYSNSGGNSNSDENNTKESPDAKMGAVQPMLGLEPPNSNAAVAHHAADDDGSARENRLMDKKRKRMDKRREYEEQVKLDMNSSSSDDQETSKFAPGKPVTLDTALSFSRTARYVNHCSVVVLVVPFTNPTASHFFLSTGLSFKRRLRFLLCMRMPPLLVLLESTHTKSMEDRFLIYFHYRLRLQDKVAMMMVFEAIKQRLQLDELELMTTLLE